MDVVLIGFVILTLGWAVLLPVPGVIVAEIRENRVRKGQM